MRWVALVAAGLFAVTALAGCSSSAASSRSELSGMDAEAARWSKDAVLLGMAGLEAHHANASTPAAPAASAGSDADLFGNWKDEHAGDGVAPVWLAGYYSPDKRAVLTVKSTPDGISRVEEQPVGDALADVRLQDLRRVRDDWKIDSVQAMRSVRDGNLTLAIALNAPRESMIVYAADLEDDRWEIRGTVDGLRFSARVGLATGHLTGLDVSPLSQTPQVTPQVNYPPPAPIHKEGSTNGGVDPLTFLGFSSCTSPNSQCLDVPFATRDRTPMVATLNWTQGANDYDLYLLDSQGRTLAVGGNGLTNGDVTPGEEIDITLEAGNYTLRVQPWMVAQDTFTLDATFK